MWCQHTLSVTDRQTDGQSDHYVVLCSVGAIKTAHVQCKYVFYHSTEMSNFGVNVIFTVVSGGTKNDVLFNDILYIKRVLW